MSFRRDWIGRGEWIRTTDLLVPNQGIPRFALGLHRLADPPYSRFSVVISATSAAFPLLRLAATWGFSVHGKGKKKAKSILATCSTIGYY